MFSVLNAIVSSSETTKPIKIKTKQKTLSLGESIKRLFGVHSKTKRSLAEEAESGDELSVGSWIREGADPNEHDAYG